MNKSLWEKIKKAASDSIKNPGKNNIPLPKFESEKYPEIYVFRHGESFDNRNKIFSGWRDSKWTEIGEHQAHVLANKLKTKEINICITSPLSRSKDTARIALHNHEDVIFEEDLRIIERSYGDLQGTSKERLMMTRPELAIKYRRSYDFPPPNGESIKMVEKRVFDFCSELVERIKKNNINVAISCHGNSMRAIRRYFEKLSIVEEITIENPLAQDFAQYVVKTKKWN
jgi:2,3-bisphosphoglycerate-dependent phosphoglycerate mutase